MLTSLVASIPSPPGNSIGLGPFQLRVYGLAIAVGVLVAVWIAQRRDAGARVDGVARPLDEGRGSHAPHPGGLGR